jgi:hypothetical protein
MKNNHVETISKESLQHSHIKLGNRRRKRYKKEMNLLNWKRRFTRCLPCFSSVQAKFMAQTSEQCIWRIEFQMQFSTRNIFRGLMSSTTLTGDFCEGFTNLTRKLCFEVFSLLFLPEKKRRRSRIKFEFH